MTHNMVAQKARVSEFLGLAVYDADDEQIGTVADIVMEKQSGKARLALISLREPAGDENEFLPVPFENLSYSTHQDGYILDIARKRLARAPTTGSTDPGWNDDMYLRTLHDFYSVATGKGE